LFQPFFKSTGQYRNNQGNGLGLSICKNIAEKLGGSLEVESQKDSGSTFTFTFSSKYF